ncbi:MULTISPECIES: SDR family oxidoreductase [Achromobacter]|uniref:SDR family oxidoreductase n=1 Tax=Alcaligenes xylosoxydans xylosoxydans TaxID=85698 RepID=A0A424W8R5_ALCXX|nr:MULTISPECIES: SDR family oxidoreductase [Achromobacter]MBC9905171.1 SDR family oxidoreductase [Achromobacter xylosoxidans]MBD0871463.1 SDR family oxidoreductase [Achromobacter xylosoxidans]QNP85585.1 SDR family oxidoreductase [Achromobacter xylosoxidans]RPJ89605.1 SDR family oxidoreductase [Achromobacter xylosoxidans]
MSGLSNKIAIVTGAGSGFGAAIARAYAKANAKVVLADLNLEAAQRVAKELGENGSAVACDVSNGDQVQAMVRHCVARFGAPDVVINNAGTTHRNQPMLDVDEATFDRVFAVNVKSIYLMAQAVIPLMREKKDGVIINVGSVGAIRPRPGLTWYNSSKGAVRVMTKSMAAELASDGIRVNLISPVMAPTGLLNDFMGVADNAENRARFVSTIPLGRMCDPDDVANVAVFLASAEARFLTGVEVPVDGGRSI